MNKIEYALKLAKECTYADEMMESAKEHLRNVIDEALKEVLPQANVSGSVCVGCGKEKHPMQIVCEECWRTRKF